MIFIVEDEPVQRLLLKRSLMNAGYTRFEIFDTGQKARAFLGLLEAPADPSVDEIELFLFDYNLPDGTGVELIREVRADARFGETPIVMVTANEYEGTLTNAFEAGVNDFLRKPFRPSELRARIRGLVAWKREADKRRRREAELRVVMDELEAANERLEAGKAELQALADELKAANAKLSELSRRDPLTGMANRRVFEEQLGLEWRRALRNGTHLAVVMLDIDAFKAYNDRYGHPAGDRCLRRLAGALAGSGRRAGETAARYGGEEFVLLLPATDEQQAEELAQRIRATVEELEIPHADHGPGVVTASLGVAACIPGAGASPDGLVARADAALYRAKAQGRNRVEVAGPADAVDPQPMLAFGAGGAPDETDGDRGRGPASLDA